MQTCPACDDISNLTPWLHASSFLLLYSRVPNRRIDTPIVSVRFFASDTFIIVRLNTDTLIKFPNESRKHADVWSSRVPSILEIKIWKFVQSFINVSPRNLVTIHYQMNEIYAFYGPIDTSDTFIIVVSYTDTLIRQVKIFASDTLIKVQTTDTSIRYPRVGGGSPAAHNCRG